MYVPGQDNIVGEPMRTGKTQLQIKQDTPGTPEHSNVIDEKLKSKMRPLKKALIQFKMGAVQKAYNNGEEAVLKSVDSISSMETLKNQIKVFAPGYFKSER